MFFISQHWDHQYKKQAEKCLLFLLFARLSASSNLCFLKMRILGNFTNSLQQVWSKIKQLSSWSTVWLPVRI
jgi:hypothetical protein